VTINSTIRGVRKAPPCDGRAPAAPRGAIDASGGVNSSRRALEPATLARVGRPVEFTAFYDTTHRCNYRTRLLTQRYVTVA